ncbi:zinc finger MYM-type protein 1-like [Aphis craccivora]|uniref:Zinc finger MYM-type protein 1-like n=1 Tax=Aphis craccivora TaxID=307492 RepID=A0A6G0WEI4_APHCR|nr:zinc finger MYM-type protein 1-like [Aphis craccivora]
MSNDESLSVDTIEGAKCLLRLLNFKIFILLNIWDLILTQIDIVNCSLQSKNQTVDTASFMLKGLILSIINIRNNGFDISMKKAKPTAAFLSIPSQFQEKRSKIAKRHFDDSPNDEHILKAEQELKRECYLAIDSIISNFSWRYEQMNKVVSDFGFLNGNKLFNMKSEDVLKWSKDLAIKYSEDLNGFDLYSELECFKNQAQNLMGDFKSATPLELLKFIHKYSLKDVYLNIEIALRIFLTIPVTTATCERSFSKLKIIKNYLRYTTSQDRLTNMGIITVERELATKINFKNVIVEFATKKARKSANEHCYGSGNNCRGQSCSNVEPNTADNEVYDEAINDEIDETLDSSFLLNQPMHITLQEDEESEEEQ